MVDMDMWAMPLMMMLMLPLMFLGVFVAQYNSIAGIITIFGADFSMVPIMRLSRKLAQWRAGLIRHIVAVVTSKSNIPGWEYPGLVALRWKKHPTTIGTIRNYRCPDGHVEPLVYVTPIPLPRLFNRIRHPHYNQGGRLPGAILVHPLPFDEQFRQSDGFTTYGGYSVKVGISRAWLDEIMPSDLYLRNPQNAAKFRSVSNHVPYVDEELRHWAWYYVAKSSGSKPMKPQMLLTTKGAVEFPCPKCEEAGKPNVALEVEDDVGRCANGHELDMVKP